MLDYYNSFMCKAQYCAHLTERRQVCIYLLLTWNKIFLRQHDLSYGCVVDSECLEQLRALPNCFRMLDDNAYSSTLSTVSDLYPVTAQTWNVILKILFRLHKLQIRLPFIVKAQSDCFEDCKPLSNRRCDNHIPLGLCQINTSLWCRFVSNIPKLGFNLQWLIQWINARLTSFGCKVNTKRCHNFTRRISVQFRD